MKNRPPRRRVETIHRFPDMAFDIEKIKVMANARRLSEVWTVEVDQSDPTYSSAAIEELAKIINAEILKTLLSK